MATLRLQLVGPHSDDAFDPGFAIGIVANIYPAERKPLPEETWRQLRNRVIPFEGSPQILEVEVPYGSYIVEAKLPTGGVSFSKLEVRKGDTDPKRIEIDPVEANLLPRKELRMGRFERFSFSADDKITLTTGALSVLTRPRSRRTWGELVPGVLSRRFGDFAQRSAKQTREAGMEVTALENSFVKQHSSLASSTSLKYEEVRSFLGIPPTAEKGERRYYFFAGKGSQWSISMIPTPWRTMHREVPISVDVINSTLKNVGPDIHVSIEDIGAKTLLGYLQTGNIPAAASIVVAAQGYLYHKQLNRFAAAAGAYVLLESWRGADADNAEWHQWVENLSRWFEDLPDGLIIRAWLALRSRNDGIDENDRLENVGDLLLRAVDRGIPFYTFGLKLLVNGLTILANDANTMKKRHRKIADTLALVNWFAVRADTTKVFTTIRFEDPGEE